MTAKIPPSKVPSEFCPYCADKGFPENKVDKWGSRSVETGQACRWTRCETCYAMWREVYNYETHLYVAKEHWKPRA